MVEFNPTDPNIQNRLAATNAGPRPTNFRQEADLNLPNLEQKRELGTSMAEPNTAPKATSSTAPTSTIEALPLLSNVSNFARKNMSRAMWLLGFGTSTLSILGYFLIGSKLLGMIFGAPALMSFYIAHSIGKKVTGDPSNITKNPLELIKSFIDDPRKIERETVKILQAVEEAKDLMETKPQKKEETEILVNRLRDIVLAKLNQVKDFNDRYSSSIKLELERLRDAMLPIPQMTPPNPEKEDQKAASPAGTSKNKQTLPYNKNVNHLDN